MQRRHRGESRLSKLAHRRPHTAARIEQQNQPNGSGFGGKIRHGLRRAFMEDDKVLRLEAADHSTVFFYEHFGADQCGRRTKGLCEDDG